MILWEKIGNFGLIFFMKSRFPRLAAQRAKAGFFLTHDVGHTKQIRLRKLQFAQRFVSPALVFHDAGGFFNQNSPVHRPRIHESFYFALAPRWRKYREKRRCRETNRRCLWRRQGLRLMRYSLSPERYKRRVTTTLVKILECRRGSLPL